jgi:AraC-like DNA-binding protein
MDQFEVFGQYRSLILEILHRQTQDLRQQERKQYSANITKALIYIQENYTADISLEKCAEIVGCSYTSLSKEFIGVCETPQPA